MLRPSTLSLGSKVATLLAMTRRFVFALAGTLALAGLFLSVRLRPDATLENSLVDLSIEPVIPPRAVWVASGTSLTGDLTNQTLTAAQSPYILSGTARIPPGVTIRAEPGTVIYAAEGAAVHVEGSLRATGTAFSSNQQHERRKYWHGIVAVNGGRVELERPIISDATVALTCAPGGRVRVTEAQLWNNSVGLASLAGNADCALGGTAIVDARVGVHVLGGSPTLERLSLKRVHDGIRVFHEGRPRIRHLTARRIIRSLIAYRASPTLFLRDLTLPPTADQDALIADGADAPTYLWNGVTFPTGRVIVQQ